MFSLVLLIALISGALAHTPNCPNFQSLYKSLADSSIYNHCVESVKSAAKLHGYKNVEVLDAAIQNILENVGHHHLHEHKVYLQELWNEAEGDRQYQVGLVSTPDKQVIAIFSECLKPNQFLFSIGKDDKVGKILCDTASGNVYSLK